VDFPLEVIVIIEEFVGEQTNAVSLNVPLMKFDEAGDTVPVVSEIKPAALYPEYIPPHAL
jgi:hypothetical protein